MGDFGEALEVLSQAISAAPTPSLYTFVGITFGKMGLYDKAIDAFNAALKMEPNYTLALYNLAVTYETKDLPEKADQIRKRIGQTK
jgi:tetratricopeptide (TPR) repeat protein